MGLLNQGKASSQALSQLSSIFGGGTGGNTLADGTYVPWPIPLPDGFRIRATDRTNPNLTAFPVLGASVRVNATNWVEDPEITNGGWSVVPTDGRFIYSGPNATPRVVRAIVACVVRSSGGTQKIAMHFGLNGVEIPQSRAEIYPGANRITPMLIEFEFLITDTLDEFDVRAANDTNTEGAFFDQLAVTLI